MPRVDDFAPSFNVGELSPRLAARTDFSKYRAGMETCENLIPLSEGALMRRAGTRYVAEVASSAVKGRLKRFQFSTSQAYQLELGANTIRFFRSQGQVAVADTSASVTNGTFDSDISGWSDISTGGAGNTIAHTTSAPNANSMALQTNGTAADDIGWAEQAITTVAGAEIVLKFRVRGDPGDKIEFQVGTSTGASNILAPIERLVGYHCVAFTPTGVTSYIQFRNLGANADKDIFIDDVSFLDDEPLSIDTPYAEADLYQIEGPQSGDTLYVFHGDYPTHKLERYGDTTWSLTEVAWQDGPWLDINSTATTLAPAATSGVLVNVNASSIKGINGGLGWSDTDVGRLIRIDNPSSGVAWGWGGIVNVPAPNQVQVHIKKAFGTTNADTRWRLGAWSETTGYPQVATFFEQRLYAAATANQPQTLWASQTADFENHKPDDDADTVEDDDALDFTLSADDVNAIQWLSAGEDALAIGTSGGEWIPSSTGAVITPNDITVRRQTTHGSSDVAPARVGAVVLFVQRAKRKLREFGFSFENDGFRAPDMTRLSSHITYGGIVEIDYAQERESVVAAVRTDGQLLMMTYRREEDVVGWSRQIVGGSFGAGDAVVESVSVIPGANDAGQTTDSSDRDEIWVIVKRTINGATKRYVEFFERDWEQGFDVEDAYYADSIITYDSTSTATITGLDHLEGETVKVWADGAEQTDKTVSSGSITIDTAASVVQVGLGYFHHYKGLKWDSGNPAGTAVGKIKRIHGITFVLLDTYSIKYGPNVSKLLTSTVGTDGGPLFSGELTVAFDGPYDRDSRIEIRSDSPSPFTLLAIAPETNVNRP